MSGARRRRRHSAHRDGLHLAQAGQGPLASRLPGEGQGEYENPCSRGRAGRQEVGVHRGLEPQYLDFPQGVRREAARGREPQVPQRRLHPDRHSEVRRHQVLVDGRGREVPRRLGQIQDVGSGDDQPRADVPRLLDGQPSGRGQHHHAQHPYRHASVRQGHGRLYEGQPGYLLVVCLLAQAG